MAVSDDNVQAALTYLAADPHPVAVARFNLTTAENKTKEVYANLFLTAGGSNEVRRACVEADEQHIRAKETEADCVLEFERHRARVKAAECLLEIWRTQNANARAAERIR